MSSSSKPLVSPEDISSDSNSDKEGVAISSPIRVTPDRDRSRKGGRRRGKDGRGGGKKLSVKERLFVSRKTIGEWRD